MEAIFSELGVDFPQLCRDILETRWTNLEAAAAAAAAAKLSGDGDDSSSCEGNQDRCPDIFLDTVVRPPPTPLMESLGMLPPQGASSERRGGNCQEGASLQIVGQIGPVDDGDDEKYAATQIKLLADLRSVLPDAFSMLCADFVEAAAARALGVAKVYSFLVVSSSSTC